MADPLRGEDKGEGVELEFRGSRPLPFSVKYQVVKRGKGQGWSLREVVGLEVGCKRVEKLHQIRKCNKYTSIVLFL